MLFRNFKELFISLQVDTQLMGFGLKCSILNRQVVHIEKSKLNIATYDTLVAYDNPLILSHICTFSLFDRKVVHMQGCHIPGKYDYFLDGRKYWEIPGNIKSLYYEMLEVNQIRYQNTCRQVSVVLLGAFKTISSMYLNNTCILRFNIQFSNLSC